MTSGANHKKKLVGDRWEVIEPYVSGKRVLDLGCVDHKAMKEKGEKWLHKKVRNVAGELLGVDYQQSEVDALNAMGYRVVLGNVEQLNLGEQFDVVLAGNIIEHLSNPGMFLEAAKRHLRPDSIFILTTDNCFGLRSLRAMMTNDQIRPNEEHVLTFEEAVLRQLFERHGFKILDFYYYNGPYHDKFKGWVINTLCKIRKSFAWQMLVVAQKT